MRKGIFLTRFSNNVAITGGKIMDSCTRNGQVRGFEMVVNGRFGVGLTGT